MLKFFNLSINLNSKLVSRQFKFEKTNFFSRQSTQSYRGQPTNHRYDQHQPSIDPSFQNQSSDPFLGSLAFVSSATLVAFFIGAASYQDRIKSKFEVQFKEPVKRFFSKVQNVATNQITLQEEEDLFEHKFKVLKRRIANLSVEDKIIYGLLSINITVFGLWQIPRLQQFMARHFLHSSNNQRYYTTITSTFSHKDLFHLGMNMMALYSFGKASVQVLGPEQFIALYLGGGMLASITRLSFVNIARRFKFNVKISSLPSLGASGALFTVVAHLAYVAPNISTYLIFLPMIPIKLGYTLSGLMTLDLMGIIRGWQMFDHFAHLGGATFGLLYASFGKEWIWIPVNKLMVEFQRFLKKYT